MHRAGVEFLWLSNCNDVLQKCPKLTPSADLRCQQLQDGQIRMQQRHSADEGMKVQGLIIDAVAYACIHQLWGIQELQQRGLLSCRQMEQQPSMCRSIQ